MLRVAVIGCGNIANDVHMPSDENKMKAFAEKYNADKYFSNYNEMLGAVKPEAVICLVSEGVIHKAAADILHAGAHALIEKPPGRDINELNHIINAAKAHEDLKIMVAFNRRFAPVYAKVRELCADKEIRHIAYGMHRINRRVPLLEW